MLVPEGSLNDYFSNFRDFGNSLFRIQDSSEIDALKARHDLHQHREDCRLQSDPALLSPG